mmetsp:Transcript_48131/g.148882  ORF Transcript_48131/g.148882 Transcript_48131/m.148882 type:complete len:103 (+) Transcript_48131:71-379(+)
MARRSSSTLLAAALCLAALWALAGLSAPAFASPPKGAAAETAEAAPARFGQAAQASALGAALAVAGAEPAFAEGAQYPGLPYVLVFVTVFSALFIIPNSIWK